MEKLPRKAGSKITKKEAKDLVEAFRQTVKTDNACTYYSIDVFQRLQKLPGCVGIRIYPGLQGNTFTPVLVAVDSDGNNIYNDPSVTVSASDANELAASAIEERGATCPPYCPNNGL